MGMTNDGVLDLDIESLFKLEESPTTEDNNDDTSNMTETMTKRINKVREKAEREAKEAVAKELGYDSYDEIKKTKEKQLIKDSGYDPEELEAVLEPILKQRLSEDPRLKKLEEIENMEKEKYIQSQLDAIHQTTGQKFKLEDLGQETLDLWSKGVDLEKAFYATQGKTIITKGLSSLQTGSLNHLATGSGAGSVKTRRLTEDEKDIWRSIMPDITEEELAKKTTNI